MKINNENVCGGIKYFMKEQRNWLVRNFGKFSFIPNVKHVSHYKCQKSICSISGHHNCILWYKTTDILKFYGKNPKNVDSIAQKFTIWHGAKTILIETNLTKIQYLSHFSIFLDVNFADWLEIASSNWICSNILKYVSKIFLVGPKTQEIALKSVKIL